MKAYILEISPEGESHLSVVVANNEEEAVNTYRQYLRKNHSESIFEHKFCEDADWTPYPRLSDEDYIHFCEIKELPLISNHKTPAVLSDFGCAWG